MSSCGFRFLRTDNLEAGRHITRKSVPEERWLDSRWVPSTVDPGCIHNLCSHHQAGPPRARLLRPITVALLQLKLLPCCSCPNLGSFLSQVTWEWLYLGHSQTGNIKLHIIFYFNFLRCLMNFYGVAQRPRTSDFMLCAFNFMLCAFN